jgi:hypothetical protein
MELTPAAVWLALSRVHGDAALEGESGDVHFGGSVDRRVPLDKLISIQRVEGDGQPERLGFCGRVGSETQDGWCPPPESG